MKSIERIKKKWIPKKRQIKFKQLSTPLSHLYKTLPSNKTTPTIKPTNLTHPPPQ